MAFVLWVRVNLGAVRSSSPRLVDVLRGAFIERFYKLAATNCPDFTADAQICQVQSHKSSSPQGTSSDFQLVHFT